MRVLPAGPLPPLPLPSDEVHVWLAAVEEVLSAGSELVASLTGEERAKAEGYRLEADRRRSLAARGLLRHLAGVYLGIAPQALVLGQDARGRPELAPALPLRFNVSHSGDAVALAFSRERMVGVDIEARRPIDPALLEKVLHPLERRSIEGLSLEERNEAFFRFWTCKEAFAKGLGRGLEIPFPSLRIVMEGADRARVERAEGTGEGTRWSIRLLRPAEPCAAAVAAEGTDWRLVSRVWRAQAD